MDMNIILVRRLLAGLSGIIFHTKFDPTRFNEYVKQIQPGSYQQKYMDIFCRTLPNLFRSITKVLNRTAVVETAGASKESKFDQHDELFESWINTFKATEAKHTLSELSKTYTTFLNIVLLAYSRKKEGGNITSIIHGSFAIYLINNKIKYHDIDCMMYNDYKLMVTICLIFYFCREINLIIESIPMIFNHRRIYMKETPRETLMDVLHMDQALIGLLHKRDCIREINGYNIIHPIIIFFNYFKMLPLQDRRNRIAQDKTNEIIKLRTLWNYILHVNMLPDKPKVNISVDATESIIRLKYNNNLYHIYSGLQDKFYTDALTLRHLPPGLYTRKIYRQYSGLLAEIFVEIIQDNKLVETHINFSRNEVYFEDKDPQPADDLVSSLQEVIASPKVYYTSLCAILATIGIFDFINGKVNTASIIHNIRYIIKDNLNNSATSLVQRKRIKNTGLHIVVDPLRSFQALLPKQGYNEHESVNFIISEDRVITFQWN